MKATPIAKLIAWIIADTEQALAAFKGLSPSQVELAKSSIKRYRRKLLQLSAKGSVFIEKAALHSFDAHFCAVLRAGERGGLVDHSFLALKGLAEQARQGHAGAELVTVHWREKDDGGFRLIVKPGILRNTRSYVLRDALTCLGFDNPYDHSRRGAGGEKAFVSDVVTAICDGRSWVATADIRRCFASMRPTHFKWVPLNEQLLRKEVFISEEAKIEVILPKSSAKLWNYLQSKHGASVATSIQSAITCSTTQMVRQALPEGSLLSPLLARSFIGCEIQASLGSMGVAISSYMDNLAICACAQPTAAAAMQALEMRLKSHPAGPIELHAKHIRNANEWKTKGRAEVLKYVLEPGHGYGNNKVHVKPGPLRIEKFKAKLRKKLDQAAKEQDLFEVGLIYWRQWYASQQAWTKVPLASELVSEVAAMSYIEDYIHGNAMGTNVGAKKAA